MRTINIVVKMHEGTCCRHGQTWYRTKNGAWTMTCIHTIISSYKYNQKLSSLLLFSQALQLSNTTCTCLHISVQEWDIWTWPNDRVGSLLLRINPLAELQRAHVHEQHFFHTILPCHLSNTGTNYRMPIHFPITNYRPSTRFRTLNLERSHHASCTILLH